MAKYIHTSNEVYFVDNSGNRLSMYRPNCKVFFKDKIYDSVSMAYGGQIVLSAEKEKYIINDGFRNELVKAGYIILDDYDKRKFDGSQKDGDALRDRILVQVQDCLAMYNQPDNCSESESWTESDSYHYTLKVDTVEDIVKFNHVRKDNGLTYYPFHRDMDKYGTVYLSIFAIKQTVGEPTENKSAFADGLIRDIMLELGSSYHYISCPIKGMVIRWDNI